MHQIDTSRGGAFLKELDNPKLDRLQAIVGGIDNLKYSWICFWMVVQM